MGTGKVLVPGRSGVWYLAGRGTSPWRGSPAVDATAIMTATATMTTTR
jgi:hypothetical protein